MRQPGLMAAAAWAAVNEVFGRDPGGRESLLGGSHQHAWRMATCWRQLGRRLVVLVETNLVWAYLWATIVLWLASWLARAFWFTRPLKIRNQWLAGAFMSLV